MISFSKICSLVIIFSFSSCGSRQDIDFKQVHIGINGWHHANAISIANERDLQLSWLPNSLSPMEYAQVRSQVDFSRQSLLVLSVGEQISFSGTLRVTRVHQVLSVRPLNIFAKVGVRSVRCSSDKNDRPFVIVTVEKPNVSWVGGFDLQYFDDGCEKS
jgi:hypothetical protein